MSSPADEHAQLCHNFDTERSEIRSRLVALCPPNAAASDAQLEQMSSHSQFYRDQMALRYGAAAETYRRQGLTYLAEQLAAFREELDVNAHTFAQILQDRRRSQADLQTMRQRADTDIFAMRQQAIDYQRRATHDSNRMFMQANFGPPYGPGLGFCQRCARPLAAFGRCGFCCY